MLANPQRLDPYKNFKFRLVADGRTVLGAESASSQAQIPGLALDSSPVEYRAGSDPLWVRKMPGRSSATSITLKRGVIGDLSFQNWVNKVKSLAGSGLAGEVPLANFRKDLYLELYQPTGQRTARYKLLRCWVSAFSALPNLSGNSNAVAIEHIHIENEGVSPG